MKSGTRYVGPAIALIVAIAAVAAVEKTSQAPQTASIATQSAAPTVAAVATDTRTVAINVTGMYCASCETTVHSMLKRSPGVITAEVNVGRGVALVAYDPAQTTPQKLADVINSLGYKATLPRRG